MIKLRIPILKSVRTRGVKRDARLKTGTVLSPAAVQATPQSAGNKIGLGTLLSASAENSDLEKPADIPH
jgi:hypothetical protein